MRIIALIVIISAFGFQSFGQQYDSSLIPYRKGKLWGYCDPDKKIIIEPKFSEAHLFEGLLAKAKVDSHYCIINRQGNVLCRDAFFWPKIISEGRNYAEQGYGGYKIYNETGTALKGPYASIEPFNEYGYAEITGPHYSGQGLLDKQLNEVLTPKYKTIQFLSDQLLSVIDTHQQKCSLYNLKTHQQLPGEYEELLPQREGLIMARKDSLYGFINGEGSTIIPFKYLNSTPLGYGPAEFYEEKTNLGYNLSGFYCGRAVAIESGKTGYLNRQGNVAIPFEFDKGFGYTENRAWVEKNGKWGMIDTNGRYVVAPVYSYPEYRLYNESLILSGYHEGMVLVTKRNKTGYADAEGKIVVPCKYSNGESFYHGLAAVSKKGRVFFIDKSGNEVMPPASYYAELSEFENKLRLITFDGTYGSQDNCEWNLTDSSGKRQIISQLSCGYEHKGFIGKYALIRIGDSTSCIINRQSQVVYQSQWNLRVAAGDLIFSDECHCYIDLKKKIKYCE